MITTSVLLTKYLAIGFVLDTLAVLDSFKLDLFLGAKVLFRLIAEAGGAHLGRGLVFLATTIGK